MTGTLNFKRLGLALSGVFVISYLLCVGFGLVVSESWQMNQVWEGLLPGFTWLTWPSFFLGYRRHSGSRSSGWRSGEPRCSPTDAN